MRIPDPTLIQANLAPAPVPAQPPPVAATVPVTPPPSVGPDLMHLSANAEAMGMAGDNDPGALRQMLVSGLLQLLAGDHALTPELSVGAQVPAAPAPAPAGPAAPAPTASGPEVGDLHLRVNLSVTVPDGGHMPVRAELVLHPGMLRYAPGLVAALEASVIGTVPGMPTIQVPLSQLPPPQLLGFHLLLNPAALWPLSVTIASGLLKLLKPGESPDEAPEEQDPRPLGRRVHDWLELHRERMAQR